MKNVWETPTLVELPVNETRSGDLPSTTEGVTTTIPRPPELGGGFYVTFDILGS